MGPEVRLQMRDGRRPLPALLTNIRQHVQMFLYYVHFQRWFFVIFYFTIVAYERGFDWRDLAFASSLVMLEAFTILKCPGAGLTVEQRVRVHVSAQGSLAAEAGAARIARERIRAVRR